MRLTLIIVAILMTAAQSFGATWEGAAFSGASAGNGGGGGGGPVADCTDGVDCLCDTIYGDYPGAILGCADFEEADLAGVGGYGSWDTIYNPGAAYADGYQCVVGSTPENTGPPYYVGFWGDSAAEAIDKDCLAHVYEGHCEVSGETDCNEDGSGGTYALGHRFEPGQTRNHGFTGQISFTRTTTLSATWITKWSANYRPPSTAHKGNEFGDSASPIYGASNWFTASPSDNAIGPDIPRNHPFVGSFITSNSSGPTPQRNVPTGTGQVSTNKLGTYFAPDPGVYEWGTTFGPGQWACVQFSITDVGSTTSPFKAWIHPVGGSRILILDMDIDTSFLLNGDDAGFNKMRFDSYANDINASQVGVAHRLEDNIVLADTVDPIPCSAVSSSFPAP